MSNPSIQNVGLTLAQRLVGVSESATLKLNATVQQLKAQGVDIVNLTAGEPDSPVPDAAKEAAIRAIQTNQNKYTPVPGILPLREAIAAKTNAQQASLSKHQPWKASHVVVSNGGKQAIFNTLMALINPGDEVLIPSPYWLSYPEMVKLAGGVPKVIPTSIELGFKVTPDQLKQALSSRTKLIIFNSPSNPSGVMYSKAEFSELGKVLHEEELAQGVWILSDEIYDQIILGKEPFCSFLEAAPQLVDRTITVNGMSKSVAMTGWRIGWSVAHEKVTQALITLQGQSTSGINAPAQWASIAGLGLPSEYFKEQVEKYQGRKKILLENLKNAPRIEVVEPDGAFYVFIGIKGHLRAGEDSMGFAQRLLEEAQVAVIPGTPFGEAHFIRISFATDEKSILEGCKRIVNYLQK